MDAGELWWILIRSQGLYYFASFCGRFVFGRYEEDNTVHVEVDGGDELSS